MALKSKKTITISKTYCIAITLCSLLHLSICQLNQPTTNSTLQPSPPPPAVADGDIVEVKLPSANSSQLGELLQLAVNSRDKQQLCDTTANCTRSANQICMNGRCGCMPNYKISKNGECLKVVDCTSDICSQQDPNRYCESLSLAGIEFNHCICKPNFIEDPLTLICRRKCLANYYGYCEQEDENSLCNVYQCQCKTNYRRNAITGKCEPFRCQYDAQCWTEGDKYRSCVNGTCACMYEVDPITKSCTINLTSLFKIRYYYSWRTERILLATIFIVPIVFYYCFLQNFRKAKSTIVSFRAPRPGEQFYGSQAAHASIAFQSPKFMTESSGQLGQGGLETTVVKSLGAPASTKVGPSGDCKGIKYERFQ